jgi:hypothetical protein
MYKLDIKTNLNKIIIKIMIHLKAHTTIKINKLMCNSVLKMMKIKFFPWIKVFYDNY